MVEKTVRELSAPITAAVEELQLAMVDAREAGCTVLLMIDATTNPCVPMPCVRIMRDDEQIWSGAWHLVDWDLEGAIGGDDGFGLAGPRKG